MGFLSILDKNKAETGRTFVEMLGVLAVIGVLTILSVTGYRYAMKKYTANVLLQEVHVAYMNEQNVSVPHKTDWTPVSFTPKCRHNMLTSKDEDGDTFVLIQAIENDLCQLLIQEGNSDQLLLSQQPDPEKQNFSILTECSTEPMNIVFSFNGTRIPGKNCTTDAECTNSVGGYCNTEIGICQCPPGTEFSEMGASCVPVCNTKTETECVEGNIRWCCGGQTICGQIPNECLETDGYCRYSFKNSKLNVEIPCPKQKYCYLAFTSKGCSNTAGESGSNPLWGVCLDMDSVFTSSNDCPVVY